MGIITFLIFVALIGLLVYFLITYVPMPPVFRQAIIVIAIILVIVWFLNLTGLLSSLNAPLRR